MQVEAADGREWRVRRRWFGRRAARFVDGYHRGWLRVMDALGGTSERIGRSVGPPPPAWSSGMAPSPADSAAGAAGCALLPAFVVAGLVGGAIDLLLRGVFGTVALVGHVALRRPWTVVAENEYLDPIVHRAVGWGASNRLRDQLAESLRTGRQLTTGGPVLD